jgi:hypothetical protein
MRKELKGNTSIELGPSVTYSLITDPDISGTDQVLKTVSLRYSNEVTCLKPMFNERANPNAQMFIRPIADVIFRVSDKDKEFEEFLRQAREQSGEVEAALKSLAEAEATQKDLNSRLQQERSKIPGYNELQASIKRCNLRIEELKSQYLPPKHIPQKIWGVINSISEERDGYAGRSGKLVKASKSDIPNGELNKCQQAVSGAKKALASARKKFDSDKRIRREYLETYFYEKRGIINVPRALAEGVIRDQIVIYGVEGLGFPTMELSVPWELVLRSLLPESRNQPQYDGQYVAFTSASDKIGEQLNGVAAVIIGKLESPPNPENGLKSEYGFLIALNVEDIMQIINTDDYLRSSGRLEEQIQLYPHPSHDVEIPEILVPEEIAGAEEPAAHPGATHQDEPTGGSEVGGKNTLGESAPNTVN